MLTREEIITILMELRNERNSVFVQKCIDKIGEMDDVSLVQFLNKLKITKPKHIKRFVDKNVSSSRFTALNDFISYGSSWGSIHIHLIPSDVHGMRNTRGVTEAELKVIDALELLRTKIQSEGKHKKTSEVVAISPIVAGMVAKIFKNLGFDVKTMAFEEAKRDKELAYFYKRFKRKSKGKKYKYLGKAKIPAEVLVSDEWEQQISLRKKELLEKLEGLGRKTPETTSRRNFTEN